MTSVFAFLRHEWDCLYGWVLRCRACDPRSERTCIKRRGHGPSAHTDGVRSWTDERPVTHGHVVVPADRRRR